MKLEPIVVVYAAKDETKIYTDAEVVASNIGFTASDIAGFCVALYSRFENAVPEQSQISFEQEFKDRFTEHFENRAEHLQLVK